MNSTVSQVAPVIAQIDLPHDVSDSARRLAMTLKDPRGQMGDRYRFLQTDPNSEIGLWKSNSGKCLREIMGPAISELQVACRNVRNVLHIRGLAAEHLPPPAPYKGQYKFSEISTTLVNIFGVASLMSVCPFAYAGENGGRIIRDVVARDDARNELSSQGWGSDLPWHIDGAYRPLNETDLLTTTGLSPAPRWLIFGVIYDSPRVPLTLVSLDDVLSRLSQNDFEVLSRPLFTVSSPESFLEQQMTPNVPVILPDGEGGHFVRFNQEKCFGHTPAARQSLAAFSRTLQDATHWYSVELTAGDVVVLDNWRSLHMRRAYSPRWDGTDRWLVRLYAASHESQGIPCDSQRPHVWK